MANERPLGGIFNYIYKKCSGYQRERKTMGSTRNFSALVDLSYFNEYFVKDPLHFFSTIKKMISYYLATKFIELQNQQVIVRNIHFQNYEDEHILQNILNQYVDSYFIFNDINNVAYIDFIQYTSNYFEKFIDKIYKLHRDQDIYFQVSFKDNLQCELSYIIVDNQCHVQ